MFVIFCKATGCVKATFTENPVLIFNLADNWRDHYELEEFPFTEYVMLTNRVLKVENGKLLDLGTIGELEASGQMPICDDCPPLFGAPQ